MEKVTVIFGGSFDPIHRGHVELARYVAGREEVDRVWLMVSPLNPLKQGRRLSPDVERLHMARLAVAEVPGVEVSDFEMHLPRPSFTYATLRALEEAYPDRRFALLIGEDNWRDFHLWRNADEILGRYPIYVYPRPGVRHAVAGTEAMNHPHPEALKHKEKAVMLTGAPRFDISSSQIRRRLAAGEDAADLLPPPVAAYLANRTEEAKE